MVFETEAETLRVQKVLNENDIFPRRYFYPSLDTLNYLDSEQTMTVSRDIASRILALPMYPDLTEKEQAKIINILKVT